MADTKLGLAEGRFADIVWEHAPIGTTELVRICKEEFEWKRTTTYTVLKRLCDRDLFRLEDGIVSVLVSRDEFYANQSAQYVDESFGGSLPAFLAAFTSKKKLSEKDLAEIRSMISKL